MKGAEKRMKSQTTLFGKVIRCYSLPLDAIEDLNIRYEARKKDLNSFGHRLAGRLDSELDFTHLIGETKIAKHIVDCMNDYMEFLENVDLHHDSHSHHNPSL